MDPDTGPFQPTISDIAVDESRLQNDLLLDSVTAWVLGIVTGSRAGLAPARLVSEPLVTEPSGSSAGR